MKNCFVAISLFFSAVLAAADTAILRFAPDSTVALVAIDFAGLMKHPGIVSTLNDPENLAARREIEKNTGVKLSDFEQMFVLVNADGGTFFLARMNESFNIEQVFLRNKVSVKKIKIGSNDVLQLTKPVRNGKIIEVTTLAPGVILAGEKGDIAKYFAQKRGNTGGVLRNTVSTVPRKTPFWIAFSNAFKNPQGKISDPQSLYLTFDFAGKNKRDYALKLVLNCSDEQGAHIILGTLPMYTSMGIAMGINDPALAGEVTGSIKSFVSGSQVVVSALISEDLGERIGKYFKDKAEKLIPQSSAPAAEPVKKVK